MTRDPLMEEYRNVRPKFEDYTSRLVDLLGELAREGGIRIHSISGRTKALDSLEGKVRRKMEGQEPYGHLSDIKDLSGVRIITHLEDEVARIASILEEEFEVDRGHSFDKAAKLDPDRFGYRSLHYVLGLSKARSKLKEYRRFAGMQFEVQVRSILQHAWAEIEHDLGYKSPVAVPRTVRRRFSRLAGLLELADDEFCRLRQDLDAYREGLDASLAADSTDVAIDADSIFAFIKTSETLAELDTHYAAQGGGTVSTRPKGAREGWNGGAKRAAELQAVGLSTVGEIEAILGARNGDLRRLAEERLKTHHFGSVVRGISLLNLAFLLVAERDGVDGLTSFFLEFGYDKERVKPLRDAYQASLEHGDVKRSKPKKRRHGA